jgi:hypothetical protein
MPRIELTEGAGGVVERVGRGDESDAHSLQGLQRVISDKSGRAAARVKVKRFTDDETRALICRAN